MSAIAGPLRRLLAASVTGALLVGGCASGGGGEEPDQAAPASTSSTLEATPPSGGAPSPTTPPAGGTGATAAGADGSTAATDPPPGAQPAPVAGGGEDAAVYVAPAGRYEYDTSGFVESGSGPTKTRREPPPVTVDEVTVVESERGVEVTTRTTQQGGSQVVTVLVAGGEARLTRLIYESTTGGVTTEYRVTPDPPILVARLPYTVGDRWESAWRDDALGIQGVGWGAVRERVHVTTPAGDAHTFVLELHQRVQGSFDGELHFTAWIDPATGVVFRQETVTVFQDPTGVSRSEITRVLRARPPAGS